MVFWTAYATILIAFQIMDITELFSEGCPGMDGVKHPDRMAGHTLVRLFSFSKAPFFLQSLSLFLSPK